MRFANIFLRLLTIKQIKIMGIVHENDITKGFSGKFGDDIVFRQIGGRTFFAKYPRKSSVVTPAMKAARSRFQKAVNFAQTMLLDPAIRQDYARRAKEAKLRNAYSAAVKDFLKELKIAAVYTDGYQGKAGDPIFIGAVDDFKVQRLSVTLQRADGSVIESSDAVRVQGGWQYNAMQANATRAGTKVIIQARDRPGRQVTEERLL
jgi:hypothetical protein